MSTSTDTTICVASGCEEPAARNVNVCCSHADLMARFAAWLRGHPSDPLSFDRDRCRLEHGNWRDV